MSKISSSSVVLADVNDPFDVVASLNSAVSKNDSNSKEVNESIAAFGVC